MSNMKYINVYEINDIYKGVAQQNSIVFNNNIIQIGPFINDLIYVFDKSNMKYASGSNFGIMNPEIGVNIMEEKRIKSGGKDFYKKFNKFSVEIFQDHLNKTTSNFYPKNKENIMRQKKEEVHYL